VRCIFRLLAGHGLFAMLAEIVIQLARFSGKVSWALDWIAGLTTGPKKNLFHWRNVDFYDNDQGGRRLWV
jgi:hypothetical protein